MALDQREFVRLDRVRQMTGLPVSTLYRMMAQGNFPRNFHLSRRSVAWDAAEIRAWQDERLAGRKQASAA